MDPVTIFLGAVQIVKAVAPHVQDAMKKGEISAERQAEVQKAFEDLRKEDFSGPEWQVQP